MDPISKKGEPFYRHFWNTWLSFLEKGRVGEGDASRLPIEWHEVTAEDVAHFLRDGPNAKKEEEGVSDITRRRYWRLLQRIYSFALSRGWVTLNPVSELAEKDKPAPEAPEGAIIQDRLWQAALQVVAQLDVTEPVLMRNKALLMLLFRYGITPQEARTLTTSAVLRETRQHSRRAGRVASLQLDGPGPNQRRRLLLDDDVADCLDAWLDLRPTFPGASRHSVIFCSQKNANMSPDNLFVLVKGILKVAAAKSGQAMPVRMGPQVVRNTCLVRWLEAGVPAPEVALRAGLKNVKGLYHLRAHVDPEVRLTLRNVRDDAPPDQLLLRPA
ncbi:tyrosine-type recombinase/integrase [Acidovorax sp.]|uniref:tyrosine-type recombinase/integrase n=1 Tax=Acidovorax sp. TaxID=1872122 RepID=UPI00391F2343